MSLWVKSGQIPLEVLVVAVASQVKGRQAGLYVVTVAGAAVKSCVFCVQVLLSKVWVLLQEASELVCERTTRGHQRQRKTRYKTSDQVVESTASRQKR